MTMQAREDQFREVYDRHYAAVVGYALRRADSRDDAADVVAETFLIAWRRLDDLPGGDDALLWLYATARRVLRIRSAAPPVDGGIDPGSNALPARMAATLREALDDGCRTRSELVALTREAAQTSDVVDGQINEVPDPDQACASADMRVGGAVSVTVRGR